MTITSCLNRPQCRRGVHCCGGGIPAGDWRADAHPAPSDWQVVCGRPASDPGAAATCSGLATLVHGAGRVDVPVDKPIGVH